MPKPNQIINFDLKLNYEKEVKKQQCSAEIRNIDMILKWVMENRDKLFSNEQADSK
jgi:hypothetical protein